MAQARRHFTQQTEHRQELSTIAALRKATVGWPKRQQKERRRGDTRSAQLLVSEKHCSSVQVFKDLKQ